MIAGEREEDPEGMAAAHHRFRIVPALAGGIHALRGGHPVFPATCPAFAWSQGARLWRPLLQVWGD